MTDVQSRIAALSPEQRELLERRLADLAAARASRPGERIAARDASQPAPLAFQQEREWAIGQFRPANNIPGAFRVEGGLDLGLLSRVLTEVVERHEVLRSTIEMRDNGTRVQVAHPVTPVPTPVADLSDLSPEQQRAEFMRRWNNEVVRRFDPGHPLRLRVSLLRMAPDTHVVLITTDHAAADLVSMAILIREFATLYAMRAAGDESALPPLEIQYADYAAWQREFGQAHMAAEVEHWRKTLDGIPGALTLPSDRPFPARGTFAGAAHFVDLSPALDAELARFIEREKVTLGVVMLAACSVLLNRYLGQDDLVIGEIVSGRSRAEIEPLIGCFVNGLPLRMRLDDAHTLRDVVRQAHDVVLTAYDHQDLPIERLVEELDLGYEALQTSMTHMWLDVRTPENTLDGVPGLRISQEPIEVNVATAPLTLDANPNASPLQLQWIYMTEMFDEDTVVLLAEQFDAVLRQVVYAPDTAVGDVELAVASGAAAAPARHAAAGGAEPGFVELFQRRVANAPHAPAVVCDGAATSYRDLNAEANRLAHHLRASGVGPESRVGILVDRSPRLPASILGVLKSGAAYVPLDPAYPPERIAFMLGDAGADVLATDARLLARLREAGCALPERTVLVDEVPAPAGSDADLPDLPDGASLAYVVYTSGSTGRPKGAMIEHRSLVTFAREVADRLGLGSGDRFLQFASPGFDVLAEELFPTWLAGGAVVIPTQHILSGEADLADVVERDRLTVMELPTAFWHEWVRELDRQGRALPPCLRLVVIGGERVLPDRLTAWRRHEVPLLHVYGLTETTVSSTFFRLDPADPAAEWPNLPIGTPLPSADLRILDRRLRPVPVGAVGELYIGGVTVGRGYLGRPGLTAHRFVADPARAGERLYRTGDLVRQRADGNLEFISRVDTQIKVRGFRVEPAEIEAALCRHPAVAEAVVTLYEPAPGDRRLVAYVVPRPGAAADAGDLRRFLEPELPGYMVPSLFVELAALPLNANGKVDRGALPAPDSARLEAEDYVAPESPVQQTLAEIVAAVVGVERVGINENFFEAGGDSILAIQVVARAQEAGLKLSPYDLFMHPTVAGLAAVATAGAAVDAEQGDVTGPVPLVPMQRAFCALRVEEPKRWNACVLLELPDGCEPRFVRDAVEHLLGHHDGLRQRFLLAGAKTKVRIAPRGDLTPFETHDLSGLDDAEQDARTSAVTDALRGSLDLAVGPLVRVALLQLGGRRPDRLVLVVHRLAADAPSMRVLLDDLEAALAQLLAGQEVTLPAKTTSWQSWARRLVEYGGTPEVQAQRAYWAGVAGAPATPLPAADGDGGPSPTVAASLDIPATDELLHAVPDAVNCRVEEVLLAALARTLTGWAGAGRHVVEVERHDREALSDDVDLSRTVGWFSRTYPVALECDPDGTPEAALRGAKEALRGVPAGGYGWQALRHGGDPLPDPAVAVSFSYLGEPDRLTAGGFAVEAPPPADDDSWRGPGPRALEVEAVVVDGELVTRWRSTDGRYARGTLAALAGRYLDEVRLLVDKGRRAEELVHTPSDFPLARVDQAQLDGLLSRL